MDFLPQVEPMKVSLHFEQVLCSYSPEIESIASARHGIVPNEKKCSRTSCRVLWHQTPGCSKIQASFEGSAARRADALSRLLEAMDLDRFQSISRHQGIGSKEFRHSGIRTRSRVVGNCGQALRALEDQTEFAR